jgi:pSer/pThr/pTyr-binding forkhead associated (FHA) protein
MTERSLADPHASTPAELKARLEAERRGIPFLLYRDRDGRQGIAALDAQANRITIGRRPDNDVALEWDSEISRVHAQLEPVGRDWVLIDDGLSRNGPPAAARRRPPVLRRDARALPRAGR